MFETAVVEFGFLIIALALSYAHVRWFKSRKDKLSVEQELKLMFNSEWNGSDEDEIYAWYRVRFQLNQLESTHKSYEKKLELVDQYVRRISSHSMRSRTVIGENGQMDFESFNSRDDKYRDLFGY